MKIRPSSFSLVASINRYKTGLLDLLVPPLCLLCGESLGRLENGDREDGFCADCRSGMPPMPEARCRTCGRAFESGLTSAHDCGWCLKSRPPFDRAEAAGLYEEKLREAVHLFKYQGRTEMVRPLSGYMSEHLEPPFYPPEADVILPVPLHLKRLKERGFNQALLLAKALFRPWPGMIRFDLLLRERWTEPQINLKGAERRKNVREAFSVPDRSEIQGRRVMLVDDVFTTGATVGECARILKKAGAAQVLVLTLARVS